MVFAVLLSPSAVGGELVNDLICWVYIKKFTRLLGFWGRVTSGALSGESGGGERLSIKGLPADDDFSATKYCQAFSQTSKESLSCLWADQSCFLLLVFFFFLFFLSSCFCHKTEGVIPVCDVVGTWCIFKCVYFYQKTKI